VKVTVVIPCLNEQESIERCLGSLVGGDYPRDLLEVLVVDGGSTDGTVAIIERWRAAHGFIALLANPRRTQQSALNIGVRAATGDLIIRMDGHSRFSPDYISKCVSLLASTGADSVGGRLVTEPRRNTLMGRAIAAAMSERFGVGNSSFRLGGAQDAAPQRVKTVPYACYRRDVFDRIGLFNEALDRSEDAEFHQRMQEHGCLTLFSSSIVSYYAARSDYASFARHAVDNGRWALLPTLRTGRLVVSIRHLLPLICVVAALSLAGAALFDRRAAFVLLSLAGLYVAAAVTASLLAARRRRDFSLALTLPGVFATMHFGYGWGSLLALLSPLTGLARRRMPGTGTA
jgi:succinoglycan biosynthesis protein ExoA